VVDVLCRPGALGVALARSGLIGHARIDASAADIGIIV
jgi:hypothetical protein